MIRLFVSSGLSLAMFYLLAFRGPFPIIRTVMATDQGGTRYLVLQGQHVPNLLLAMLVAAVMGLVLTMGVVSVLRDSRILTWVHPKPPPVLAETRRE